MRMVIGCPVRDRDWILPAWFTHTEAACAAAGITPTYVFVIADRDHGRELIRDWCLDHGREVHLIGSAEQSKSYLRAWSPSRYREMVLLRNWLLAAVREIAPDFFLSLDSDILLHEDTIVNLLQTIRNYDAVGGKCWMTFKGRVAPSYMQTVNAAGQVRTDSSEVMAVDVIMAIKLMSPAAYNVDYVWHHDGEDLGWSRVAREHGLQLGWDGRCCSKHVMRQEDLEVCDPRVGY